MDQDYILYRGRTSLSRKNLMKEKKCNKCGESRVDYLVKKKGGHRSLCKSCHAKYEKERKKIREQENPELKSERIRKGREYYKQKREQIGEDLDARIYFWATQWRNTPREGRDRSQITQKNLVELTYKGLEEFPYMLILEKDKMHITASVDRIDSKLGYTDDNIQVIPYWLNSAKLNMEDNELREYMSHFLRKEDYIITQETVNINEKPKK